MRGESPCAEKGAARPLGKGGDSERTDLEDRMTRPQQHSTSGVRARLKEPKPAL